MQKCFLCHSVSTKKDSLRPKTGPVLPLQKYYQTELYYAELFCQVPMRPLKIYLFLKIPDRIGRLGQPDGCLN